MSIQIIEIRQFQGPATVELSGVGVPEIVEVRQGPPGLNSITSATASNGTANLSLSNVTTATATVTGTLTADHIHGNIAGSVYAHVRAGENLAKGDPVYISGSHGSGASLIAIVSKADASNASKMPAVGVMDAAVSNNANGHMVITGTISDIDTNAYAVNSVLYVASGGGWTSTPPASNSQPVAIVERSNTNNGAVIVKVNGLASYGGNGASDANKLVRFGSDGSITVSSTLDSLVATTSAGTAVAATATDSGIAVFAESLNQVSVLARSTNSTGLLASSSYGSYIAEFENLNVIESAIERVRGWFVWFYNTFTGRLKTADITANREWTLPNKSGTILLDSDLGTNVATFLATPTSANLAAAVTDGTGSGSLVFADLPTLNSPAFTYSDAAAAAHRTSLSLDRYYVQQGINQQSSTIVYDFDNSYMPAVLGVSRTIPSGGSAQVANVGGTHWTSKVKGWLRIGNPTANDSVTEVGFGDATIPYQSGTGAPTAHNNYTLVYVFCCPNLTNVDIRLGLRTGNVARIIQIFQDNVANPSSNPVFNFFTSNGTYTNTATATGTISGAPTPAAGSYTAGTGTRYAFVFDTHQRVGGTDTTVTLKLYSGNVTGDLSLVGTYNLVNWNPVSSAAVPYVSVRTINSTAAASSFLHLDTVILKSWNNTSNILPADILNILKTD